MIPLETAIHEKVRDTAAITTVFTGNALGIHWDTAPKGKAPPYLVAQVLSAPTNPAYGGVYYGDAVILFKGFAVGRATVGAHMKAFTDLFDAWLPTLTAGKVTNVVRTSAVVTMKVPASEQEEGADEHMAAVTYVYSLEP